MKSLRRIAFFLLCLTVVGNARAACGTYSTQMSETLRTADHSALQILLSGEGAKEVNCRTSVGSLPLAEAVRGQDSEAVKMLLRAGADPNIPILAQPRPFTILMVAVMEARNTTEPLVELLLAHGAHADDPGALYIAAAEGREDIVRALLAHGADPNGSSDRRCSPLFGAAVAAAGNHEQANKNPRAYRHIVNMLLNSGADLNSPTCLGHQTLDGAIQGGDVETVKLLRRKGAKFSDDPRPFPIQAAIISHQPPMVSYILSLARAVHIGSRKEAEATLKIELENAQDWQARGFNDAPVAALVEIGRILSRSPWDRNDGK